MVKPVVIETLRWLRRHWVHVAIAPVMLIVFTVLHEAAHAAAAIAQGGRVTEFVVLPTGEHWGHMRYEFPRGASYSATAISLAPYFMWAGFMGAAALMSLRRDGWRFAVASSVWVWGYVGAFGDIVNAWGPWLVGSRNDLYDAFGPPGGAGDWAAFAIACAAAAEVGYIVQRRLYREGALSGRTYAALAMCGAAGVAAFLAV